MNSKKSSKRSRLRDEQWHEENDHLVRFWLMVLAWPGLAPALQAADRPLILGLIDQFQKCSPPLAARDVMGLVVLRLTSEFWPSGRAHELDAYLASIQAHALASVVAPSLMQAAGFSLPLFLHPQAPARVLMVYAHLVHQRWQEWHRDLLDPYVPPATERHVIARGLARRHCLRQAVGEQQAVREAKRKLDGFFRRTGRFKTILETEDISAELYALRRGEIGRTGVLRLGDDGLLHFEPRAMRDALRKVKLAAGESGADPEMCNDQGALDPADLAKHAEQYAVLLDHCDEIDQMIVKNWDSADVAVAKQVGLTPQAVGKRRGKIRRRAERLLGRTDK